MCEKYATQTGFFNVRGVWVHGCPLPVRIRFWTSVLDGREMVIKISTGCWVHFLIIICDIRKQLSDGPNYSNSA